MMFFILIFLNNIQCYRNYENIIALLVSEIKFLMSTKIFYFIFPFFNIVITTRYKKRNVINQKEQ